MIEHKLPIAPLKAPTNKPPQEIPMLLDNVLSNALSWLPGYLINQGAPYQDVDDLVQRTLLHAWAKRTQCRATSPAQASQWLRAIGRSILLSHWRSLSTHPPASPLDAVPEPRLASRRATRALQQTEAHISVALLERRLGPKGPKLCRDAMLFTGHGDTRSLRARRRIQLSLERKP